MIKKYYTCRTPLKNYNPDKTTTVIRLNGVYDTSYEHHIVSEPGEMWDESGLRIVGYDRAFLVGPAADRLFEYEQLGYTPEELKEIIERDKKTRHTVVNFQDKDHVQVNGRQFISQEKIQGDIEELKKAYAERIKTLTKLEPPTKLPQDVISLIDDAMIKQDRYVSLFYGSSGISIDIYPIVEEESND